MYTKETLSEINDRYLREYAHRIEDYEISTANEYITIIEKSRSETTPKVGDRLKLTTKHGDYFQNAHIDKIRDGEAYVCQRPYVPFIYQNSNEISCSTSGGAWQHVVVDKLIYIGKELKTFCDWGSCGACANGAFEFEAEVSVWEYKEENQYGEYSTKDYDRFYLSYTIDKTGKCRDEDGYVYKLSQSGCSHYAFRNKADYNAWLKTYKGVEFGEHKFSSPTYVFVYKEISHLISEEEWNKLRLPVDTREMNCSVVPVKVKYNNDKHTIDVYRYTNRKENSQYDISMIYKLARLGF